MINLKSLSSFYNIGNLGTNYTAEERLQMILSAPPLDVAWVLPSPKLQVQGEIYQPDGGICKVSTELCHFKNYRPSIEQILGDEGAPYRLWCVEVCQDMLRLYYYLQGTEHPCGSTISILTDHGCSYLAARFAARPWCGLPARQFSCEYQFDAEYGPIVRTSLYQQGQSVHITEDYPEAGKHCRIPRFTTLG